MCSWVGGSERNSNVTATEYGNADSLIRARRALTFRIRLGRDMLDGKVDERG